jgi:hypothetical protein
LLLRIVAGIDIGATGEYNNEEGATNSDGRAPRIGPEAVFGEGVYARGGSFMPGRKGFIRGAWGSWPVTKVFDRAEILLLLRFKPLHIEPNNKWLGFSGAGVTVWNS